MKKEEKMWSELAKYAEKSESNRKKAIAQAGAFLEGLSSKKHLSKQDLKNIAGGLTTRGKGYKSEWPE